MTIARADWPQLLSLLETALDVPEPARQAWLNQLDGPASLIRELRRLLEDRRAIETGDFLQALPSLPDEPAMSSVATGSTRTEHVGPYRLVREIGRGGMSTVWLAERADQQLKRQVALKLPHTGPGQDSLATRLLREREILSGLDHPHIARLFDVGITECGTPYLVMEYVEGERLLDYADQHQLDIPHRIALFRQVLSAVQHAHTKLLLHRDLKPSNILVNRAGEVKLLDFGIAKLVSNDSQAAEVTELTRAAGQPLTLMYASPEQLRGEALTTACDVYALGVVLYELLCVQHPVELKSNSAARAEDAVLHQEPRAPSRRAFSDEALAARSTSAKALRRSLSGDLDAIVLRALAKAPEQRFGSVDAFGADIGRWAAGEPVKARAPSAWYYVGKFVARNRMGVGLGAAAMCGLLAAAAVALTQGIEARKEAQRAVASRDFLLRMFEDVDPDLAKGRNLTALQLLAQGKARLETGFSGQPALRAELLMAVGQAQRDLMDFTAADVTLTQAVAAFADLGDRRNEVIALLNRCLIARDLNQADRAGELLATATARAGTLATNADVEMRLLEAQGQVALYRHQLPQARAAFERFIQLAAKATHLLRPMEVFTTHMALAKTASLSGDGAAALQQFDQADRLLRAMPDVPAFRRMGLALWRASAQIDLGQYAKLNGWLPPVLSECDEALDTQKELCATLRGQEVRVLLKMGRTDEAVALLPALAAQVSPETSLRLRFDVAVLSMRALAWAGKFDAARDTAEELAAWGMSGADDPLPAPSKLLALNTLAEAALLAGRPLVALQWVHHAQTLVREHSFTDPREALKTRLFEGVADQALGRHTDALAALKPFCTPGESGSSRRMLDHLFGLNCVRSLAATEGRGDAVVQIDQALPVLRESLGADAPNVYRAERLRSEIADPAFSAPRPADTIDLFS
jgi:eukaryotic-like serine/threonine-protein kinase